MGTPCIEWAGRRHHTGYGIANYRGAWIGAHRATWQEIHGPIPAGLQIRHKCDNPPCVNPDHLEIGTPADNARDRITHRRNGRPCAPRPQDVDLILAADALRADLEVGHVDFAFGYIGITDGMWSMLRRGHYSAGYETARKIAAVLRLYKRQVPPHKHITPGAAA